MTLKEIFLLIIFCLLQSLAYSQKVKIDYLDDISDLVATSGKGFQLQVSAGFSLTKEEGIKNYQYNIPSIVPRYAFNEHFGIQAEIELDINKTKTDGQKSNSLTQIPEFTIGAVYEFDPELKALIFNQFSVNFDNTIPLNENNSFYSELDLNFSTPLSDRSELDYSFGYEYQSPDAGVYSFGLDYYLTPKILAEFSNEGQWNWNEVSKSFEHSIGLEISFLSKRNRQFNIAFIKGINNSFIFSGVTYIQNL